VGHFGEDRLVEVRWEIADEGHATISGLPDVGHLSGGEGPAVHTRAHLNHRGLGQRHGNWGLEKGEREEPVGEVGETEPVFVLVLVEPLETGDVGGKPGFGDGSGNRLRLRPIDGNASTSVSKETNRRSQ
jgi:hypothetical protein